MALIRYEPSQHFVLADEPEFPDKDPVEEETAQNHELVVLEEWRTYYLKWFGEKPDFVEHLPKSPFTRGQEWSGQVREINFNNYVGLARIGPLRVHVENRKIGDDLFHALLDNVTDHYADLIFGFDEEPVGHGFDRKGPPGRNLAYVEYLFLRRYLLTEDIEGIVEAILRNPHTRMLWETRSVPLGMALATDPVALLGSLCRGHHITLLEPDTDRELCATPLGQALLKSSGRALFPAEVPEERRYHTYDTHENRFVKHVLEELERRLDDVSGAVRQHTGGLVNPEIGSDLEGLKQKVGGCLDDPFWREVGPLRFLPQGSTVLQRREGYRQLYRLHALLQLLTRYDYDLFDFENLLETKDTATLYEYWCFFQVKGILDERLQRTGTEILVPESDTRQELSRPVCLSYERGLTLCYNWHASKSPGLDSVKTFVPHYSWGTSSTGELRPDIVIEYAGRRLVLDAKNKGRGGSGFFGSQEDGTIKTPKPEDIVKMHAYRDAIKGVQGAFALFPGTENVLYPAHGATQPWNGIGALALRPDSGGKPDGDQYQNLKALIWGFTGAEVQGNNLRKEFWGQYLHRRPVFHITPFDHTIIYIVSDGGTSLSRSCRQDALDVVGGEYSTEVTVHPETERTVKMFLARVKDRYRLREAYLFGSRSKGLSGPQSDADIAVLLHGRSGRRADTAVDMAGIAFDVMLVTGVLVDAIPFWEEEWEHPERFRNPALIENIRRDGVRL